MALLQVQVFSQVLGIHTSMHVILPETSQGIGVEGSQAAAGAGRPLPVLYLLHGLSDDHSIWLRRTSVERYVTERHLAVVMPAVNRSFYTDQVSGYRYWTYISEELPQVVQHLFKVSDRREHTFAAGLSMGGYGALKLGLRLPDRYAAVASLSGATDMSRLFDEPRNKSEAEMTFGSLEVYQDSENDLYALARQTAVSGGLKPKIFQCCGTADFLYEDNRKFKPHLEKLGYDLVYKEKKDAVHEWGYWDEMIQQVLDWLPLTKEE